VTNKDNPNYASAVAVMKVYKNGKLIDTLLPERRFYKAKEEPTTEVALRSSLKEDLYVVLSGFTPSTSRAVMHVFLNPLVSWIWIGGLVFMLGTIVCLIPDRHEKAMQKVAAPVEAEELAKA
jgi:cytochrome c-type biogenesis protein CcmF